MLRALNICFTLGLCLLLPKVKRRWFWAFIILFIANEIRGAWFVYEFVSTYGVWP